MHVAQQRRSIAGGIRFRAPGCLARRLPNGLVVHGPRASQAAPLENPVHWGPCPPPPPPPPPGAGIRTVQIMLNGCVPVIVQVRSQHAPARTASACAISLPCAGLVPQACWSCWAGSAGSQSNHRKVVLSRGSPSPCLLQEHVIQSHEEVLPYEAFSIR
ncbi:hypothetical protein ABPG77_007835 [Micractinium sp. CCAP 211/92]